MLEYSRHQLQGDVPLSVRRREGERKGGRTYTKIKDELRGHASKVKGCNCVHMVPV
jgi:hypothetical protein